ncbi:MAG: hypothetical protein RLP09_25635 [Sandaracinaceae bacterium]|nr:hypothetical protein [Myxococcales bacterium]
MNRELLASLVLATSLFSSSCAVDDVSLVGKLCPCQREGYLCVAGTCQPEGSCGGGGLYQVGDLEAEWTTPHVVHWTWNRLDDTDPSPLEAVEIIVGTAEENAFAVERCACRRALGQDCDPASGVRVIGPAEYRELAFDKLLGNTMDAHNVREVATLGLEPDTRHAAVLVSRDRSLAGDRPLTSVSNVAFARTQPMPRDLITVFDEVTPPSFGATYPDASCNPHVDGLGYRHQVACPPRPDLRGRCKTDEEPCPESWPGDDIDAWLCEPDIHPEPESACWISFRWQGLDVPVSPRPLRPGRFETAYYEITATMTSDLDLDYVEFETRLTDEVARDWEEFGRGGLRMRGDGVEHVYEIPLRSLIDKVEEGVFLPHTPEDLAAEQALTWLRIGSNFAHGADLHIRSIRLRF